MMSVTRSAYADGEHRERQHADRMDLLITSLAERPDLAPVFDHFPDSWPEFMYHDHISAEIFDEMVRWHPESNLIAIDPADEGVPVARACAFPFSWTGDPDHGLPQGGYDRVLISGATDRARGIRGTVAAALEVTVRPDARGNGLSGRMLGALRDRLRALGYPSLVVPVRPNRKHLRPAESMSDYLSRTIRGCAHTCAPVAASPASRPIR
jgi:GNAT superfamily N-acetyltransferase